jgi:hypothetical protein
MAVFVNKISLGTSISIVCCVFEVEDEVKLPSTVSRPMYLGVGLHLELITRLFFSVCAFLDVQHTLWWEDGSVI